MSDSNPTVPPSSNLPYVTAAVCMTLVGVLAITLITIFRPAGDNSTIITTIVGFIAPTTLSLLALMKAQETHLSVNSRLDAFIVTARDAAHAQGLATGLLQGRDAANQRNDALLTRQAAVVVAPLAPAVLAPTVNPTETAARLAQIEQNTAATVTEIRDNTAATVEAVQQLKGTA